MLCLNISRFHRLRRTENAFYIIEVSQEFALVISGFNSLPNDTILDWFKLKALADDKTKLAKMMIFVCDRVQNIVGKGKK